MTATFYCNPVDTFDFDALRAWVERERASGALPAHGTVSVEVVHRDREMDGSCRWCGCRENEVIELAERLGRP